MLAYAADIPKAASRAHSPKALTLIIASHAVLIAAVMTAKMELVTPGPDKPPVMIDVPPEPVPPEPQTRVEPRPEEPMTQPSFIEQPTTIVDMDATSLSFDRGQAIEDIAAVIGTDMSFTQLDPPKHEPVKLAAVFRTPESAVKPPYPIDKRREGEEATLRLKLTITRDSGSYRKMRTFRTT